MQQKKLELLAPAGDWERLEMALAYGADDRKETLLWHPFLIN